MSCREVVRRAPERTAGLALLHDCPAAVVQSARLAAALDRPAEQADQADQAGLEGAPVADHDAGLKRLPQLGLLATPARENASMLVGQFTGPDMSRMVPTQPT